MGCLLAVSLIDIESRWDLGSGDDGAAKTNRARARQRSDDPRDTHPQDDCQTASPAVDNDADFTGVDPWQCSASSFSGAIPNSRSSSRPGIVYLGVVVLVILFGAYAISKELDLRTLTEELMDERVLAAASPTACARPMRS